jgi:hypothetical protein
MKRIGKVAIVVLLIFLFITAFNKLFNNIVSESFSLLYLYFTSDEQVEFEKMLIRYPYNYLLNVNDESAVLHKFPRKEVIIIFKKSNIENSAEFIENFQYRLKKLGFTSIIQQIHEIDGQSIHALIGKSKNSNEEYKAYIFIPLNKVIIEYFGTDSKSSEFWSTIKSVSLIQHTNKR